MRSRRYIATSKRIIAVWSNYLGTPEANTGQFGTFTLSGKALPEGDYEFPLGAAVEHPNATLAYSPNVKETKIIPCKIPVIPGHTFKAKVTLADDQSTTVWIGVFYE